MKLLLMDQPRGFCLVLCLIGLALPASAENDTPTLSLQQAIDQALANDPWLTGNRYKEQSLDAASVAAGTLPDPTVSLTAANLPIDSFDMNQEAMTQLKVGVSQQIPRGKTLSLKKEQLAIQSAQQPFLRADRKAKVSVSVALLWLDAYLARESIQLIERDRELFEHLVDVAESSYSSALGRTRQQDLIRAQLELTRLEDRLTVLNEQYETAQAKLSEWLEPNVSGNDTQNLTTSVYRKRFSLSKSLPSITFRVPELLEPEYVPESTELLTYFEHHPAIQQLDQKINASHVGIDLARQKYKPQWGINASYAYREDDPMGNDRSDFVSVGVSFDLPLFTANRQDMEVRSAAAQAESVKTEKVQLLRTLTASFNATRARLLRLNQRHKLYQGRLLEEMHQQAEASLTAYTSDDGDFAEVVRARIAEVNARIEALGITVSKLKTIIQLNYFLYEASPNDENEASVQLLGNPA